MFRTVPLSIIRSFSLYTQQWCMSYSLLTACEQDQDGTQFHSDPAHYSEKLLMMDRGLSETCRVSFKNKFQKLVHLVGLL
jgi:hypothetical protein